MRDADLENGGYGVLVDGFRQKGVISRFLKWVYGNYSDTGGRMDDKQYAAGKLLFKSYIKRATVVLLQFMLGALIERDLSLAHGGL